jgi:DNA-binding CsgD family transcriptional regulator
MWVLVSGVLKDPERLRRGLDDMLEREIGAGSLRPQDEDAERWLRSLSELDAQEERLLDLYLEGKLETKRYESRASRLKKSRKTVKGELERIVNTGSLASSG